MTIVMESWGIEGIHAIWVTLEMRIIEGTPEYWVTYENYGTREVYESFEVFSAVRRYTEWVMEGKQEAGSIW